MYGMVRHDDLLLTAIDAHVDLLRARLQLSYLLDDSSVFPTAYIFDRRRLMIRFKRVLGLEPAFS